jgi:ribosomal protein S18 acetylase RimI-like enzyme
VEDPREEAAKRALAAATAGNVTGRPAESVRPRDVKLKDNGNVSIAAMTEEDCVDATKLIMELFFKVRPQDFLAKDRLKAEQAERVYGGLVQGVVESEDRLLLAAKVGGKLVGVAEVSLPGGARFGAEKFEPKAPADAPYVSDVAVAPNQRGRGIGKSLLRACEAAVVAEGVAGGMYLHTKVDNDGARALFERGGVRGARGGEGGADADADRAGEAGEGRGRSPALGLVEGGARPARERSSGRGTTLGASFRREARTERAATSDAMHSTGFTFVSCTIYFVSHLRVYVVDAVVVHLRPERDPKHALAALRRRLDLNHEVVLVRRDDAHRDAVRVRRGLERDVSPQVVARDISRTYESKSSGTNTLYASRSRRS